MHYGTDVGELFPTVAVGTKADLLAMRRAMLAGAETAEGAENSGGSVSSLKSMASRAVTVATKCDPLDFAKAIGYDVGDNLELVEVDSGCAGKLRKLWQSTRETKEPPTPAERAGRALSKLSLDERIEALSIGWPDVANLAAELVERIREEAVERDRGEADKAA